MIVPFQRAVRPSVNDVGLNHRRLALCLAVVLWILPAPALAQSPWVLDAADWARPRTAEVVLGMPAVADAMRAWSQSVDSELVLHHPPDEAGQLWAHELRAWLIALGVPGDAIARMPDHQADGALRLSLRRHSGGS